MSGTTGFLRAEQASPRGLFLDWGPARLEGSPLNLLPWQAPELGGRGPVGDRAEGDWISALCFPRGRPGQVHVTAFSVGPGSSPLSHLSSSRAPRQLRVPPSPPQCTRESLCQEGGRSGPPGQRGRRSASGWKPDTFASPSFLSSEHGTRARSSRSRGRTQSAAGIKPKSPDPASHRRWTRRPRGGLRGTDQWVLGLMPVCPLGRTS